MENTRGLWIDNKNPPKSDVMLKYTHGRYTHYITYYILRAARGRFYGPGYDGGGWARRRCVRRRPPIFMILLFS